MTKNMWTREDQVSDDELHELRFEIVSTMDDHAQETRRRTSWRERVFPKKYSPRHDSAVHQRMRMLRSHAGQSSLETASDTTRGVCKSRAPRENAAQSFCSDCNETHHNDFAPNRFDTVEHSLGAIHDLACYLDKSPRTIWLALEGIFTARQTTSAPTLFRHRIAILTRVLPTAVGLLILAFILLHFLLPNQQTDVGYTPLFSELGFLVFLMLFTTVVFFVLAGVMLLIKSSLQERFLNGFSRLVNWSIPIVLSFFMASPEFLLLFQELAGSSTTTVSGIENIITSHNDIVEVIYWTVLAYVAIYTGTFFSFIAFSKVFAEQREYVHRHEVLRDVIAILVSNDVSTRSQKLFRVHQPSR